MSTQDLWSLGVAPCFCFCWTCVAYSVVQIYWLRSGAENIFMPRLQMKETTGDLLVNEEEFVSGAFVTNSFGFHRFHFDFHRWLNSRLEPFPFPRLWQTTTAAGIDETAASTCNQTKFVNTCLSSFDIQCSHFSASTENQIIWRKCKHWWSSS